MFFGNKNTFAIESGITQAYERLGFRALGYFVLHIGGFCYGVRESDATLLACAFDEAKKIILNRGNHTTPFANELNPGMILNAFRKAVYAPDSGDKNFFGLSKNQFSNFIYSSHCGWHWACDEAFDDGGVILHFDVGNRVRLIADKPPREQNDYLHDPKTLRDVWLDADEFYGILEKWRDAFEAEWQAAPKISECDDGAEQS